MYCDPLPSASILIALELDDVIFRPTTNTITGRLQDWKNLSQHLRNLQMEYKDLMRLDIEVVALSQNTVVKAQLDLFVSLFHQYMSHTTEQSNGHGCSIRYHIYHHTDKPTYQVYSTHSADVARAHGETETMPSIIIHGPATESVKAECHRMGARQYAADWKLHILSQLARKNQTRAQNIIVVDGCPTFLTRARNQGMRVVDASPISASYGLGVYHLTDTFHVIADIREQAETCALEACSPEALRAHRLAQRAACHPGLDEEYPSIGKAMEFAQLPKAKQRAILAIKATNGPIVEAPIPSSSAHTFWTGKPDAVMSAPEAITQP